MSTLQFFRGGNEPVFPVAEYTMEFQPAAPISQTGSWGVLGKIVSFPFVVVQRLYSQYAGIAPPQNRQELCLLTPAGGKALLKAYRNDPEKGLFVNDYNIPLFNLVQELYPSEKVTEDDFIFTCQRDLVNSYRQPIIHFAQPGNIKKCASAIEESIEEITESLSQQSDIDATELSLTYSTAMVAKLLLGHPGPFATYKEIAEAASLFLNGPKNSVKAKESELYRGFYVDYSDLQNFSSPETQAIIEQRRKDVEGRQKVLRAFQREQQEKRKAALETLRQAIDTSLNAPETPLLGSLVEKLRSEGKLTDLQIKSVILSLYVAGSDTTTSVLSPLLWQLAHNQEDQEQVFQEVSKTGEDSPTLDRLFAQAVRLYTPVREITRMAGRDLLCIAKDKEGHEIYRKEIPKGTLIHYEPWYAGRNLESLSPSDKEFSWLPFGDGKHACPGRWLAKAEIVGFISSLVKKYKITTSKTEAPKLEPGIVTSRMEEKIPLSLERRNS